MTDVSDPSHQILLHPVSLYMWLKDKNISFEMINLTHVFLYFWGDFLSCDWPTLPVMWLTYTSFMWLTYTSCHVTGLHFLSCDWPTLPVMWLTYASCHVTDLHFLSCDWPTLPVMWLIYTSCHVTFCHMTSCNITYLHRCQTGQNRQRVIQMIWKIMRCTLRLRNIMLLLQ